MRWLIVAWLLVQAAWISPALAQEEESVEVYKSVSPCVVSLKNSEISGTGIIIRADGLILTNAHMLVSPLPMQVEVEAGPAITPATGPAEASATAGTTTSPASRPSNRVTFINNRVVGFHPLQDLALLQLDLSEHPEVKLNVAHLAGKKPSPGQRVYAIGNPSAGNMSLDKTITSGMLSGIDRDFHGIRYYQFSAQVNPGNSGGPLVDRHGAVLGVVTFKITDVESIGFALPVEEVNAEEYIPLSQRTVDPLKARRIIAEAQKASDRADDIGRRLGADDQQRAQLNYYALLLYHEAMLYDVSSADTYYNMGMLLRSIDHDEAAVAYLMRSARMKPWNQENGDLYHELGLAYAKLLNDSAAYCVWLEGLSKYPRAERIWDDLAVFNMRHNNPADGARCATIALNINDPMRRTGMMMQYRQDALMQVQPGLKDALMVELDPRNIALMLDERQTASDAARNAKRLYITETFNTLINSYGGFEAEAQKNIPAKSGPATQPTRPSSSPSPVP